MGLLIFIIFGFFVGLLARAIMPGRDPMGLLGTALLGMGGSLLGWFIGRALGLYHSYERLHAAGFLMSLLGAFVLLALGRVASGRRRYV